MVIRSADVDRVRAPVDKEYPHGAGSVVHFKSGLQEAFHNSVDAIMLLLNAPDFLSAGELKKTGGNHGGPVLP